jgi:hypothetical protein
VPLHRPPTSIPDEIFFEEILWTLIPRFGGSIVGGFGKIFGKRYSGVSRMWGKIGNPKISNPEKTTWVGNRGSQHVGVGKTKSGWEKLGNSVFCWWKRDMVLTWAETVVTAVKHAGCKILHNGCSLDMQIVEHGV